VARLAAGVLIAAAVLGGAAPAAAQDTGVRAAVGDPNDFVFDAYDARYELGRDADGRSTLLTTETLTARFPDFDQNRGLQRDLVRVYDGHSTELEVLAVTDELGQPREYRVDEAGDFATVTIAVPEGQFVHGVQHYVLTYRQHDVTASFEDTGADEFYWDLNGTGWSQPFARVSARVVLDDGLADVFTGAAFCYRGAFGSGTPCEVRIEAGEVAVDEAEIGPGENVTVALGFPPGTFRAKPAPFLVAFPLLIFLGVAAALAAIAIAIVARIRNHRGARTGRAIIAQYEPPDRMSVAVSARLVGAPGKAMTATLLDLAVRGRIRLLHDAASGVYGAQLLDAADLLPIERAMVARIFPGDGAEWFDRRSTRLGDAAAAMGSMALSEARTVGLVTRSPKWPAVAVAILLVAAIALPTIHAVFIAQDFALMTVLLAVGMNAIIWVGLALAGLAVAGNPRTHAGALVHDHLMGLREYIRLAEADRIRMLQSASGAEVGPDQIVQIYERLLPYAVLFGMEREWQEALEPYYRVSPPEWASGTGARAFTIAGLGMAVRTSPATQRTSSSGGSRSSFSSSSGGSSGGGFSGGGGGGGGGRGI